MFYVCIRNAKNSLYMRQNSIFEVRVIAYRAGLSKLHGVALREEKLLAVRHVLRTFGKASNLRRTRPKFVFRFGSRDYRLTPAPRAGANVNLFPLDLCSAPVARAQG